MPPKLSRGGQARRKDRHSGTNASKKNTAMAPETSGESKIHPPPQQKKLKKIRNAREFMNVYLSGPTPQISFEPLTSQELCTIGVRARKWGWRKEDRTKSRIFKNMARSKPCQQACSPKDATKIGNHTPQLVRTCLEHNSPRSQGSRATFSPKRRKAKWLTHAVEQRTSQGRKETPFH